MVSRLADRLIDRYARNAGTLLDPFAGSGAILLAAKKRGIQVSGADINPISALFTRVKLDGFEIETARRLLRQVLQRAYKSDTRFDIRWPKKSYWFTSRTIEKFEAIRGAFVDLDIPDSPERAAVLLSLSLSVRMCSRADQRSPKPFISKRAIALRKGRHFDPFKIVPALLKELSTYYGTLKPVRLRTRFFVANLRTRNALSKLSPHSRIITSPPYLNAQDYFRNFKLELYVLEGILPFEIQQIKDQFIGTERGVHTPESPPSESQRLMKFLPAFGRLARRSPRGAAIIRRYFSDMDQALRTMCDILEPQGTLVIVCGDNLVAGEQIRTWRAIADMVEELGLELFDLFKDPIKDRLLAPKRLGHVGLIKEEVVMAFRKH